MIFKLLPTAAEGGDILLAQPVRAGIHGLDLPKVPLLELPAMAPEALGTLRVTSPKNFSWDPKTGCWDPKTGHPPHLRIMSCTLRLTLAKVTVSVRLKSIPVTVSTLRNISASTRNL